MVISIVIFIIWLVLGILLGFYFQKMLKILVEYKKGNYFYCYWKLWLSFNYFKKFINETNLNSEQKEMYTMFYRRGKILKIFTTSFFFLIFLWGVLEMLKNVL